MPSPFDRLKGESNEPSPSNKNALSEEWGGQFSCQTHRCNGYALVATYYPKARELHWVCQEGHSSMISDIE